MFDATAPWSALCAEPMTASEIDSHPDSARIWATIEAARSTIKKDIERDTEETIKELQDECDDSDNRIKALTDDWESLTKELTFTIDIDNDGYPRGISHYMDTSFGTEEYQAFMETLGNELAILVSDFRQTFFD